MEELGPGAEYKFKNESTRTTRRYKLDLITALTRSPKFVVKSLTDPLGPATIGSLVSRGRVAHFGREPGGIPAAGNPPDPSRQCLFGGKVKRSMLYLLSTTSYNVG